MVRFRFWFEYLVINPVRVVRLGWFGSKNAKNANIYFTKHNVNKKEKKDAFEPGSRQCRRLKLKKIVSKICTWVAPVSRTQTKKKDCVQDLNLGRASVEDSN